MSETLQNIVDWVSLITRMSNIDILGSQIVSSIEKILSEYEAPGRELQGLCRYETQTRLFSPFEPPPLFVSVLLRLLRVIRTDGMESVLLSLEGGMQ